MIGLIRQIGLIGVIGIMSINPTFAIDRETIVNGARTAVNANWSYVNTITNAVNAGPVLVGSADKSLPAYQQINQITAQIQALKLQMKNFSVK